jgi:hypothetical protein
VPVQGKLGSHQFTKGRWALNNDLTNKLEKRGARTPRALNVD